MKVLKDSPNKALNRTSNLRCVPRMGVAHFMRDDSTPGLLPVNAALTIAPPSARPPRIQIAPKIHPID